VWIVKEQIGRLLPCKLEYEDKLSGLLWMLKETLPHSSSWFLELFPCLPLTLFRLLEETPWTSLKDFADFRN
jgi:hypothetical protein